MYYAGNETNGAYYTWCNATASKGRYCSGATTTVDDSEYSICPRGWKLPTKAQYDTLAGKQTGSWNGGWTLGGGFFPAAGIVADGSSQNVGLGGWYWSSTALGSDNANNLYFNSSVVYTNYNVRYSGNPIRCIAP